MYGVCFKTGKTNIVYNIFSLKIILCNLSISNFVIDDITYLDITDMIELFSTPLSIFTTFLVSGVAVMIFILQFDKRQRRKLNGIMAQAEGVQPILMRRSAVQKLHELKEICETDPQKTRSIVAYQLEELVAEYDKGNISLTDYCNQLNRLLGMVA